MRAATTPTGTASHRGRASRNRHCSGCSSSRRSSSSSWWPRPPWPHAGSLAPPLLAASGLHPLSAWDAPATAPVRPREPSVGVEYDVLGVGQAAVDVCVSVTDDMLSQLDVAKGGRRLISVAERASVMQSLEGLDTQVSAGGSLANTLVGLAQLASAQERAAARRQQQQQQPCGTPTTTSSLVSPASTDPQQPNHHRSHQQQRQPMRVALTGPVTGADALGEFAAAQLKAAGVAVVGPKPTSGATGTVMVLSTEDAQRSFLSCFSNEDSISLDAELAQAVSQARLLVIEGYLWEVSGSTTAIPAMVRQARAAGTLVVLTAGDAGVVQRHAGSILAAIAAGVDVLFSNEAEAAALTAALKAQQQEQQQQQQEQEEEALLEDAERDFTAEQLMQLCSSSPSSLSSSSTSTTTQPSAGGAGSPAQEAALQLASVCPMVAVTDGSRGAFITALGQLIVVPPFWRAEPPVDTCGAGDAWAAGFLYGLTTGLDLHSMGHLAAKTASAVISRHGPQLLPDDADWVLQGLSRPAAGLAGLAAGAGVTLAGVRPAVADEAAASSSPSPLTGRSGAGDRQ